MPRILIALFILDTCSDIKSSRTLAVAPTEAGSLPVRVLSVSHENLKHRTSPRATCATLPYRFTVPPSIYKQRYILEPSPSLHRLEGEPDSKYIPPGFKIDCFCFNRECYNLPPSVNMRVRYISNIYTIV